MESISNGVGHVVSVVYNRVPANHALPGALSQFFLCPFCVHTMAMKLLKRVRYIHVQNIYLGKKNKSKRWV